jgi:dGTPase
VGEGLDDGFEGNAQSFRIVTRLASYRESGQGLNLTASTLNALLKYPWHRSADKKNKKHKKWNAYETEAEIFKWARERSGVANDERTLEAELMDWADDIAYSIHDLEDFYRAGHIPLHELAHDAEKRDEFVQKAKRRAAERQRDFNRHRFKDALDFLSAIFRRLPRFSYDGSAVSRLKLRKVITTLLRRSVNSTKIKQSSGRVQLDINSNARDEIEVLKELTWQYVIDGPPLASQQLGQSKIVENLFEVYLNAINKDKWEILPLRAREWLQELRDQGTDTTQAKVRIVVDLIAGMDEAQAATMYHQFNGILRQFSLNPIVM